MAKENMISVVLEADLKAENFQMAIDGKTKTIYNSREFKKGDTVEVVKVISEKSGNPYYTVLAQKVEGKATRVKKDLSKDLLSVADIEALA